MSKSNARELVPVTPEVRAKFLALGDGSLDRARAIVGISDAVALDLASPGGVVRRKTLEKVLAKLAEVGTDG